MFTFLKLMQPFFLPPTFILIGLIVVFFLIRKRHRLGTILLGVIIVIYYVLSIEPTAYLMERTLTRKVQHASVQEMQGAQVIVVLGGGAHTEEGRRFPELGGVSWKRFWHGIEMYRALEEFEEKVPILYVGGSGDPFEPVSKEAELARSYAVGIGIPEEQFWTESQSRDTYENGAAVKRILEERFSESSPYRAVLVTSATHMPRARQVFEKQGMEVIPGPADFGTADPDLNPLSFFPSVSSFSSVIAGLHEWLGIFNYRARGRI